MVKRAENNNNILVLGASRHPLRDAYHFLLRLSWASLLGLIAGTFLLLNAFFAFGYLAVGGVAGVRVGFFRDAFFFSVHTMGTIGYGTMYPISTAAHSLVVVETVIGLILAALTAGIIFTRFSLTRGELVLSRYACIAPMNGVPTLVFRIGNDRTSTIFEASVRVAVIRTEKTSEGITFYRLYDVDLVRDRSPALARSWTVMHSITEKSPLYGQTAASCAADEIELSVTVAGTDDTSLQPVHARYRYAIENILWDTRLIDILTELPDGRLQLDLRLFHDVVPVETTQTVL